MNENEATAPTFISQQAEIIFYQEGLISLCKTELELTRMLQDVRIAIQQTKQIIKELHEKPL
jgi:hypothetical protein